MATTNNTTNPNQNTTQSTQADVQVVPGAVDSGSTTQIGITDLAGQLATNPGVLFNNNMSLTDNLPTITAQQVQNGQQANASPMNATPTATASTVNDTAQVGPATGNTQAAPVETAKAADKVEQAAMTGAQGTVSSQAQIDPNAVTVDTNAVANGQTASGQALNKYASQNISNIIDTSTLAGKILAENLGEGNYTDSKATLKGQLDILQAEFVDPTTGQPKIPSWAAATARQVSRIAAFTGMTGTAATAAMAQALMEASLPIAQADSQFFQTVTMQNLSNRQEATINKANVLSKLDLANMDARLQVAVTNANNFMQMDLKNLDNAQQAEVINTQSRVQAILEDANSENANRLFVAQSQNEKDMFYSQLGASIEQYNASQINSMKQFNASQTTDVSKFNSDLENNREQFYKNMQFQIDTANAKWRQTVTLTENDQAFQAAATDVKNIVGVSVEQLNRLWDRSDAILDYAWKSAENDADRKNQVAMVKLQAKLKSDESTSTGWGNLLGTLLGAGSSILLGALGL